MIDVRCLYEGVIITPACETSVLIGHNPNDVQLLLQSKLPPSFRWDVNDVRLVADLRLSRSIEEKHHLFTFVGVRGMGPLPGLDHRHVHRQVVRSHTLLVDERDGEASFMFTLTTVIPRHNAPM